mgnify:CR=1 FL=1
MAKRVAIFADTLYQEMELWYPLYRLKEAGVDVKIVAFEAGKTYASKLGYPVVSDMSYTHADAAAFDGVIVPGGFAPDYMRRHAGASAFVSAMNKAGKLVAAICHGPWMLCTADILRGRRATAFMSIKTDVVNAGAIWEDAETVVDNNIVTARKPDDLPAFMRACLGVLGV